MARKRKRKEAAPGIAQRIREFRGHYRDGMTQRAFSDELGIDQQRLSCYEMGTRVPHTVIAGLMKLGASPDWLLFGEGPMFREGERAEKIRHLELCVAEPSPEYAQGGTRTAVADPEQLSDFYILPLYADEAAAGEPLEMRDTEIEGPAIIHRNWCPHPETTDYVRIASTGTSMEPTIPAGGIVTIDRTQTDPAALVGKVVAIGLRDDGVTVKRLQHTERGGYVGVPDNSSSEHRSIYLEEGDRVIGRVCTVHAWLG
jgi:phage repressor protein C with HTH and peptisase S24 domain